MQPKLIYCNPGSASLGLHLVDIDAAGAVRTADTRFRAGSGHADLGGTPRLRRPAQLRQPFEEIRLWPTNRNRAPLR